jgi:2-hydroxychromene-2-carboxylate isomerase
MGTRKLVFFFDYISPYAYIAWTQIHALAARHDVVVEPVPILFAALLDANGQKGPAEIETKRLYTFKEVFRTAHRLGVPLAPPASHPFNPLLALRVSSADLNPSDQRALIDALYLATWGKSLDVTDAATVAKIASSVGLDGRTLVAWTASPDAKERVKQRTAEALALGAFGVPSMLVEGELLWGFDSFDDVERRLRGEDPLTPAALEPWTKVAPSARRPGA